MSLPDDQCTTILVLTKRMQNKDELRKHCGIVAKRTQDARYEMWYEKSHTNIFKPLPTGKEVDLQFNKVSCL